MATVTKSVLNPSWIDSVTRKDHDHRRLWDKTDMALATHQTTLDAQAETIATLQAAVLALQNKPA